MIPVAATNLSLIGANTEIARQSLYAEASLDLNFLTGALDPRIEFTRASVGTYFASDGTLQTAPADTPRFNYNPVTRVAQGWLIEDAATNLLLQSATLSTQSVTVTAVAHTLSFYGTGQIVLSGTATGTVVGTGAFPTRTTFTFTPTAGTLTLTVTGTVSYAQLETGSVVSSYIPTTTGTVTRQLDRGRMLQLSPWFNPVEGTMYAEFEPVGTNITSLIALTGSDEALPRMTMSGTTGDGYNAALVALVGGAQANFNSTGVIAGVNKVVFAAADNNFATGINGGALLSDTVGLASLAGADRLLFGKRLALAATRGYLRRFSYFPRRLSNEQLANLIA